MKKFIVIGLGNFGYNIATTLMANDCEVLGMDIDRELVQRAKDDLSHAIIGDATNKEVLESLAIRDFDGGIISLGQDMAASILIALYLKEIGLPRVVVRAVSEDHGKILRMIGVSDVVFPERDMAVRVGNKLALKNAVDYLPIGEEYSIIEVPAPKGFVGKSLKQLQVRARFGCQVIGLKTLRPGANPAELSEKSYEVRIAPAAEDVIAPNSALIVIGRHDDIEKIQAQD